MSDLASELTAEVLSCSVCKEPFEPSYREARLLSCCHSFCLECLERIRDEDSLHCPECRQESFVKGSVKQSFCRDLTMMRVVDFLQRKLCRPVEDYPDVDFADLTPVAFTEFALCQDCVNAKECQVNTDGDVIDNSGASTWTWPDNVHTHPVLVDPPTHSPQQPGSTNQNLPQPHQGSSSSQPCPSPLLPSFCRIQRHCGTLGTVTLQTGSHYWEVQAVVKGAMLKNEMLCEMGVAVPGELDTRWRLLGHSVQSVWGLKVWDYEQRGSLSIEGWEATQRNHESSVYCSQTSESRARILIGFLLDLQEGTLKCLNASTGAELCTMCNLRPPLVPFFTVRPKSGLFASDVSLRVMVGEKTALKSTDLNTLRRRARWGTWVGAAGYSAESPGATWQDWS